MRHTPSSNRTSTLDAKNNLKQKHVKKLHIKKPSHQQTSTEEATYTYYNFSGIAG